MKYLFIFLIALLFTSCDERETEKSSPFESGEYSIRVIDGCEYILIENGCKLCKYYNLAITHKGNCKNPIHK